MCRRVAVFPHMYSGDKAGEAATKQVLRTDRKLGITGQDFPSWFLIEINNICIIHQINQGT